MQDLIIAQLTEEQVLMVKLIASILFGTIFLHISTLILNFKDASWGNALLIMAVSSIAGIAVHVGVSPLMGALVGLAVSIVLIKAVYRVGYLKSAVAWVLGAIMPYMILLLISIMLLSLAFLVVIGIIMTLVLTFLPRIL